MLCQEPQVSKYFHSVRFCSMNLLLKKSYKHSQIFMDFILDCQVKIQVELSTSQDYMEVYKGYKFCFISYQHVWQWHLYRNCIKYGTLQSLWGQVLFLSFTSQLQNVQRLIYLTFNWDKYALRLDSNPWYYRWQKKSKIHSSKIMNKSKGIRRRQMYTDKAVIVLLMFMD